MTLVLILPTALGLLAKQTCETENAASIGGSQGPTAIYIRSEYSTLSAIALILLAGLLFFNAYVMWKDKKCANYKTSEN